MTKINNTLGREIISLYKRVYQQQYKILLQKNTGNLYYKIKIKIMITQFFRSAISVKNNGNQKLYKNMVRDNRKFKKREC